MIPPRKDWRGQRYGFMRFCNVENERLLEVKLDNVWLEGRKLKANVTKVKRVNKKPIVNRVGGNRGGENTSVSVQKKDFNGGPKSYGGASLKLYADILKTENYTKQEEEQSSQAEVFKYFTFNYNQEKRICLAKAKVGVTKEPGLAYGVSQSLIEEGIFTIVATLLGPNLCLLEETKEGDLELLLEY